MINLKQTGPTVVVEMAHRKVNAMDLEFCRALNSAFSKLDEDPETTAVVLTSANQVFSAGIDLKRILREPPDYVPEFLDSLEECFLTMFEFSKPMVAAVNGSAVAGGCTIALTSDYRFLLDSAAIGMPESRLGVPFPPIAVEIVRSATTPAAARQMFQFGKTYTGLSALEQGLVDEVVSADEIQAKSMEQAVHLASLPADVFANTKRQLRLPTMNDYANSLLRYGSDVRSIWCAEPTRQLIEEFVNDRLS